MNESFVTSSWDGSSSIILQHRDITHYQALLAQNAVSSG